MILTGLADRKGIDRLAMFKLDLKDIRELFTQNLKWLRDQAVL